MSEDLKVLYQSLVLDRLDEARRWHDDYKRFHEESLHMSERLKRGEQIDPQVDRQFLERLLMEKANGIASRGQSTLSWKNFDEAIMKRTFVEAIEDLIRSPNVEAWSQVGRIWQEIIGRNNPVLINRIAAAATLEVSTSVDEYAFRRAFDWFHKQGFVGGEGAPDWFSRNLQLVSRLREVFQEELTSDIEGYDSFYLNQFIWYIYERISDATPRSSVNSRTAPISKQPMTVNRILYGPPGTGKTYETRKAALELLGEDIPTEREDLILRYEELQEANQIRFVTFHPSMTYEDFIEGLRPKLDSNDSHNLSYETRDGIFKAICKDARRNWTAWQSKGQERSFAQLWSEVEAELENGSGPFVIPTPGRRTQFEVYEIDDEVIRFHKSNGNDNHTLNARTLEAIFEGTREVPGGLSTYYTGLANWLKERGASQKGVATDLELKQYVLIIDEINRGNIPAIFGELITLLEPSKRMNQSEPLEVQLPSSQERFQVPPNLHVIGTMNTADRSVEALDVALRRRFEFVELMPKPNELGTTSDGLDLPAILTTINRRLEALLDRDHTIGHAFLLDAKNVNDVRHAFETKIIPLLQEFFYGEWSKIGMVLGAGFVRKSPLGKVAFAKGFGNEFDVPDIYEMIPAKDWNVDTFKGILSLG